MVRLITKPVIMLSGSTRRSEDVHRFGTATGWTLWFRYWEGQVSNRSNMIMCQWNPVTSLPLCHMLPVAGPFSDGSLSKTSTQCSLMRTCVGTHQWGSCEASSMVLRATMCSSNGCAGQYLLSALLRTQLCHSWHYLFVQNSVEICCCLECGNETLGSVKYSQSVNISIWWGYQWQFWKCSKFSPSCYSFAQKEFIACA